MRELTFRELRLVSIFQREISLAYAECKKIHELKKLVLTCQIQNHKARVEAERLRLSFEHHDGRARKIRRMLEQTFEDELQEFNRTIHANLIDYCRPVYSFFF